MMQPGGVGVATHPGEVLDPLNDLIEQFASLMLAASIAFGVQFLLAEIGAHFFVSQMQAFFEDGVHHVVKLAALFVVQTLVLPLLVLWLLVGTLRSVALPPFRAAGSTEKLSSL